jgi:hypothetical protein
LRQEDGKIYLVIFCGSLEIGHEYHYIVSCSGLKEEEKITNTQSTYNPTNKQTNTQTNKQTSERIPP